MMRCDPSSDIATAQGFQAHGPVTDARQVETALLAGAKIAEARGRSFIDARIELGYGKD